MGEWVQQGALQRMTCPLMRSPLVGAGLKSSASSSASDRFLPDMLAPSRGGLVQVRRTQQQLCSVKALKAVLKRLQLRVGMQPAPSHMHAPRCGCEQREKGMSLMDLFAHRPSFRNHRTGQGAGPAAAWALEWPQTQPCLLVAHSGDNYRPVVIDLNEFKPLSAPCALHIYLRAPWALATSSSPSRQPAPLS